MNFEVTGNEPSYSYKNIQHCLNLNRMNPIDKKLIQVFNMYKKINNKNGDIVENNNLINESESSDDVDMKGEEKYEEKEDLIQNVNDGNNRIDINRLVYLASELEVLQKFSETVLNELNNTSINEYTFNLLEILMHQMEHIGGLDSTNRIKEMSGIFMNDLGLALSNFKMNFFMNNLDNDIRLNTSLEGNLPNCLM
jgi:hypothetical protein